ncbi:thiamine-phosphate kinase [uncultured Methanobrevibacter sp.]|uniref:thiamine-phosphate kinase n=1 Tax=uncultured Methanobrevibacter sp. TaxID=253161 RepID=UPI00262A7C4D|nr:thiamine-phosphate kinase [uncultured Methanobrevibacter sp.]
MTLKVSDIGEKELINYILSNCETITPDDTAITSVADTNLISTCDMLIESKHFPENMSYFQMGFKAVTVNVSDLAAMGASPLGFLLSIALPKDFEVENFKQIFDGVLEACEYYNIHLIGGDTNEAGEIIISGTALGLCSNPLMKNTSRKGDLIVLTGDVGLAALGFNLGNDDNIYTKKALEPLAKINEGLNIKCAGGTSATDITDGLASELYEMKRKDIGFMIYEDKFNVSEEYKSLADKLNLNYLDLLLHVGEDFELVFTIAGENLSKLDFDYKVIGEVTDSKKVEITLSDSSVVEVSSRGYDHYVS